MNHGSVTAISTPIAVAKVWEWCRGYSSSEQDLLETGRLCAWNIIPSFGPCADLCWLSLLKGWEGNLLCFCYFTSILRAILRRKNRHCKCKEPNTMLKSLSEKEPACLMLFDPLDAVYAGSPLLVRAPLSMSAQRPSAPASSCRIRVAFH